jgi:bifunctional non-homologous end joining protein LigD
VVSKVRDSRYPAGRGNDCVKKTFAQRETLPIAGFSLKVNRFDGVYFGRLKRNDLVCAGKVDHSFDKSSTAELQARLKPLIRNTQPTPRSRIAAWVEPSTCNSVATCCSALQRSWSHPVVR